MTYPPTRRDDFHEMVHGVSISDPYRWLEDEKSPAVQAWMNVQNDFARAKLKALPHRDELAARLKQLLYVDEIFTPVHRGDRYFYARRHADREKLVVHWKQGKQGEEKTLLDPNTWSTDGSVSLGAYVISWDGQRVAYTVHQNNSDEATLYVLDVATGAKLPADVIDGAKYAAPSWTPKNDGFYYTFLPTDPKVSVADRPGTAEVRFHRIGADPKTDAVIHEKTGDPTTFIDAEISRDGHWLVLSIHHGWTSADVWFRDARKPSTDWTPLAVGRPALFSVEAHKDRFYVATNEDAGRYRLMGVDPMHPEKEHWQVVVPERADATLQGVAIVGGRLALDYIKDASSRLEIRELDGRKVREVKLPGVGTSGGLVGNPDEDEAFYGFFSYTVPREIYATQVSSGETYLWNRLTLPIDPKPFEVEQAWATSKDGTKIPMFLVHRRDLRKDGTTPTLLWGYGGFQIALTPSFSASLYPWLEHGGMFVVANLRGGSEFGEAWHQAGMLGNKQNVFDDFAAAAKFLVAEKYTSPERLALEGRSNGGLLMGAMITQHPELARAVVCGVPLLDMLRYHLFGSGRTWIDEYGTAEDAAQFKYLEAYSPYRHVRDGVAYPAVLMLSADADDRVDPMHARKFTAALQHASTGGPVLLRIEPHSGHGGADKLKSTVEEGADRWSFLMSQLAVPWPESK